MPVISDPPSFALPVCQAPTQAQFDTPEFRFWRRELRENPGYHRKYWEYAWLLQVLAVHGMLAPGRRGLGFGVGREPISAYLASKGLTITATDADVATVGAAWIDSGQHASRLEDLNVRWLCPPDVFAERITFLVEDMRHVSPIHHGYDFVWSLCAIEHLGDIEAAFTFVERSLQTLRPGGLAVHSSEIYCGPEGGPTLESGDTCIPRQQDYLRLAERLTAAGHHVEPLNFNLGDAPLDRLVDRPPYSLTQHLKLEYQGVVTTSFGLVVRRGDA